MVGSEGSEDIHLAELDETQDEVGLRVLSDEIRRNIAVYEHLQRKELLY